MGFMSYVASKSSSVNIERTTVIGMGNSFYFDAPSSDLLFSQSTINSIEQGIYGEASSVTVKHSEMSANQSFNFTSNVFYFTNLTVQGGPSTITINNRQQKSTVENSRFTNIISNDSGLKLSGSGHVQLTGCVFSNIGYYSTLYLTGKGALYEVLGCSFRDVQAGFAGGAIYAADTNLIIQSCGFYNNFAPFGGSVYTISSNVTLEGNSFKNSTAVNGGAACLIASSIQEFYNVFDDCQADENGGAVYLMNLDEQVVTFDQSYFLGNQALRGGAIACCENTTGCQVEIQLNNVNLVDNKSQDGSGAIACQFSNSTSPGSSGSSQENNSSDLLKSEYPDWVVYVLLGVVLSLALCVVVVGFCLYRRKHSQYESVS